MSEDIGKAGEKGFGIGVSCRTQIMAFRSVIGRQIS